MKQSQHKVILHAPAESSTSTSTFGCTRCDSFAATKGQPVIFHSPRLMAFAASPSRPQPTTSVCYPAASDLPP